MKTPKVKDFMTRDPTFLYVPGKRREAMKVFVNETISGVPVLREDDDSLVGIMTRADLFAKPHEDQLAMIMQKDVIYCHENDDLKHAAALMLNKGIHRLPVLDINEALVGIVSPLDILPYIEDMDLDLTIETVMRKRTVPLYRLMPANVALEVMNKISSKALPVLDDDACVMGILTDRDIYAHATIDTKTIETDLGPRGEGDTWTEESLQNIMRLYYDIGKVKIPRMPIEEIMVSKPTTVQTKTTVSKASRLLHRGRFNQLPVTDIQGRLEGMVYDVDILTVLTD